MLRKARKGSNSAAVHGCAMMGSRNRRPGYAHRALGYLFVLIVSAVIASCATNDPRQRANISEKQDQNCVDAYANFDSATWTEINSPKTSDATRITLLKSQERGIRQQMRDPQYAKCWDVAYEHHPSDDLTKHKPLALQDESAKACYRKPSEPAWYCPAGWTATATAPKPSNSEQAGGEFLEWVATNPAKFPDYLPIWSVMVDASIMRDHDDIWNPRIVAFIAELFRDAYDQADAIHYRRAHTVAISNADQGRTR